MRCGAVEADGDGDDGDGDGEGRLRWCDNEPPSNRTYGSVENGPPTAYVICCRIVLKRPKTTAHDALDTDSADC